MNQPNNDSNSPTFNEEVNNLLTELNANRHRYFPPNLFSAVRIHREITRGRPNNRLRMTNRRRLLRYSVARSVQITDGRVISRATDLFMKTATRQEKLQYSILAEEVNRLIITNLR
jgi:hypothetical protein